MNDLSIPNLATQSTYNPSSPDFSLWVLENIIKPKFASSTQPTITAQGRAALNVIHRPAHEAIDNDNRPWRSQEVIDVFAHVVTMADQNFVREYWHLFIPPLLSLLDDFSTLIRVRGLTILKCFLGKVSSKILSQTGVGAVFENAVMPTLAFLPSLTPVDESITLLGPAYAVLMDLVEVRFPSNEDRERKNGSLDSIIRQGIFQGLSGCRDDMRIMHLLIVNLDAVITKMGIHAVLHLREIISNLSTILANPFGTSKPELVVSSLKALQSTMLNCWPRIGQPYHYREIVKAICFCWTNVRNEEIRDIEDIKLELRVCGKILQKCTQSVELKSELLVLFEVDPTLVEIFMQT